MRKVQFWQYRGTAGTGVTSGVTLPTGKVVEMGSAKATVMVASAVRSCCSVERDSVAGAWGAVGAEAGATQQAIF